MRNQLLSCAAILIANFAPANATPIGVAEGYSVFVFGNFTGSNSDSEGPIAAGGNVSLSSYSVNSKAVSSSEAVVAGGNVSLTNGSSGTGDIVYGGSATVSNFTVHSGALVQGAGPIDFLTAAIEYRSRSEFYSGFGSSGSTVFQFGGLTLSGMDPLLNIFDVNGADLWSANAFQIAAPVGSTVVVNVSGTGNRLQNMQMSLTGVDRRNVLYNFYETTDLSMSGISVQGGVLAPYANVNFSNGNFEGTLIASNVSGSGEYHWYGDFAGDLPPPDPAAVPEPATCAMLGGGLLALGLLHRRRERG